MGCLVRCLQWQKGDLKATRRKVALKRTWQKPLKRGTTPMSSEMGVFGISGDLSYYQNKGSKSGTNSS